MENLITSDFINKRAEEYLDLLDNNQEITKNIFDMIIFFFFIIPYGKTIEEYAEMMKIVSYLTDSHYNSESKHNESLYFLRKMSMRICYIIKAEFNKDGQEKFIRLVNNSLKD